MSKYEQIMPQKYEKIIFEKKMLFEKIGMTKEKVRNDAQENLRKKILLPRPGFEPASFCGVNL